MMKPPDKLIFRDGNPECPACQDNRQHTEEDWAAHHPFRGHGFTKEWGWSHPDLKVNPK